MKHWAYIGVALIALNAYILKGAWAAEISPVYRSHSVPGLFRLPLSHFWKTTPPPEEIHAPVTVRLFAGQKLKSIEIRNSLNFTVLNKTLKGPLLISIFNQRLALSRNGYGEMLEDQLTLRPVENQIFELRDLRGHRKKTRGELRLKIVKGQLVIVNRLGLEDYVSGVVEGELGTLNLNPEVLKAQIVVARTYALSMRRERHTREGYEFCDEPHCQVFGGIPGRHLAYEKAMDAVRGDYLSYKGRAIAAFYHHNCGGMTSAVQNVWPTRASAYLVAVKEPAGSCQIAAHAHWRIALSKKSLSTCFRKSGWLKRDDVLQDIQVVKKDPSGRVEQLLILSRHPVRVTIGRFRNTVNQYYRSEVLKSALFKMTFGGDSFIFEGQGWGHGVGLCQEGAIWMSRHGRTYKQILQHYFPHTTLAQLQ